MKTYKFKINGNEYNVAINSVEGKNASVTVNGTAYQVELEEAPAAAPVQAPVAAPVAAAAPAAAPAPAPAAVGAGKAVTSPLPGVIIAVKVNVGDTVKAGQEVAVRERPVANGSYRVAAQGGGDGDVAGGVGAAGDGGFAIRD